MESRKEDIVKFQWQGCSNVNGGTKENSDRFFQGFDTNLALVISSTGRKHKILIS